MKEVRPRDDRDPTMESLFGWHGILTFTLKEIKSSWGIKQKKEVTWIIWMLTKSLWVLHGERAVGERSVQTGRLLRGLLQ